MRTEVNLASAVLARGLDKRRLPGAEPCKLFPAAPLHPPRRPMRRRRLLSRRPKPTLREALQMRESDLERELNRRGPELMRKLLQGHLDQRSPGESGRGGRRCRAFGAAAARPAVGDDLWHGGGRAPGLRASRHDSCIRSLNLPAERYSHEVRRRVAEAAASRSFAKRCSSCLAIAGPRCPSVRRNSWSLARLRTSTPSTRRAERRRASRSLTSRLWCSPSTARAWCCITRTCARRRARRPRGAGGNASRFNRLRPGEKKHAKRMATVAAATRSRRWCDLAEPDAPTAGGQGQNRQDRGGASSPVAKRVWASLEPSGLDAGSRAPRPGARQALGRAVARNSPSSKRAPPPTAST